MSYMDYYNVPPATHVPLDYSQDFVIKTVTADDRHVDYQWDARAQAYHQLPSAYTQASQVYQTANTILSNAHEMSTTETESSNACKFGFLIGTGAVGAAAAITGGVLLGIVAGGVLGLAIQPIGIALLVAGLAIAAFSAIMYLALRNQEPTEPKARHEDEFVHDYSQNYGPTQFAQTYTPPTHSGFGAPTQTGYPQAGFNPTQTVNVPMPDFNDPRVSDRARQEGEMRKQQHNIFAAIQTTQPGYIYQDGAWVQTNRGDNHSGQ